MAEMLIEELHCIVLKRLHIELYDATERAIELLMGQSAKLEKILFMET